jgi:exopolyphosphatase/pppGpp-phosphohydrolase
MSTTPEVRLLTGLHIGAMETVVSVRGTAIPSARLVIPIGTVNTGRGLFRHGLPDPLEIEHAIEAIEDALSRIHSAVPAGAALHTADPLIGRIANVAGATVGPETVLGRELVELAFNRLAGMAARRSLAQDGFPADMEFAAALLILREFMHHLQFESITVSIAT